MLSWTVILAFNNKFIQEDLYILVRKQLIPKQVIQMEAKTFNSRKRGEYIFC